jgi:predicted unusual protein kinase regulating ubiquinone biosynthesis (AarF/ABC1/UbiB family)
MNLKDAKGERRARVALNIFRAWYVPLYYYGVIHGDPHMGNYSVAADGAINLLDFGCVRVFPPRFVGGVITLYHALREKRTDMAIEAYESWGFRNLSKKTIEALNLWASFLYGPVLEDKVRPIGVVPEQGIYGRETARKVHQELKKAGGVTIPREFVFMDRAALGLGSVFLHLRAEVNWHRVFNELITDFDVKALAVRQKKALRDFGIPSQN